MRFEFDQASIKHCALRRDLTSERRLPPLCLCNSRVLFPPKTIISGDGSDSEITGNTFTITHMGLIAAFNKSRNILNYRLTFLGQLRLNEDSTMWQWRAAGQAWWLMCWRPYPSTNTPESFGVPYLTKSYFITCSHVRSDKVIICPSSASSSITWEITVRQGI